MQKVWTMFAVITVVLLLAAGEADAWGPLTHAYLAQRIAGTQDFDVICGSVAPDVCNMVLSNPTAASKLQRLTHNEFDRLDRGWFALGFATHNAEWGADLYAHACFTAHPADIFSANKILQLRDEFGISVGDGEAIFEGVMDYLVRLECGPGFGCLLRESAIGSQPDGLMVKAFAQPLSERVPGLSLADAEHLILVALAASRQVTAVYGEQFAQDDATVWSLMVLGVQLGLGCTPQQAQQYCSRAVEICQDEFMDEMDRIVALVGAEMDTREGYYLPLHAWPCALAILLIALWVVPCMAHRRLVARRPDGSPVRQ